MEFPLVICRHRRTSKDHFKKLSDQELLDQFCDYTYTWSTSESDTARVNFERAYSEMYNRLVAKGGE